MRPPITSKSGLKFGTCLERGDYRTEDLQMPWYGHPRITGRIDSIRRFNDAQKEDQTPSCSSHITDTQNLGASVDDGCKK